MIELAVRIFLSASSLGSSLPSWYGWLSRRLGRSDSCDTFCSVGNVGLNGSRRDPGRAFSWSMAVANWSMLRRRISSEDCELWGRRGEAESSGMVESSAEVPER